MKKLLGVVVLFALFVSHAEAGTLDISASGGWTMTVNASDLTSGAGSNIKDKESGSGATLLTISGTGFVWKVNVSRSDTSWNGNLTLYLKRTSDGTGSGFVAGGTSYIPIGTTSSQFFTGSGSKSNIAVQYKLGSSVSVPPGNYSTTVTFTVVQQ